MPQTVDFRARRNARGRRRMVPGHAPREVRADGSVYLYGVGGKAGSLTITHISPKRGQFFKPPGADGGQAGHIDLFPVG